MKKKKIQQKINKHFKKGHYVKITRTIGEFEGEATGFIIDKSADFIMIHEVNDFQVLGYQVIPIKTISHVRYNENDKTIDQILKAEGEQPSLKYKINLTDWKTIFNDVQETGLTVISECEDLKHDYFCIGKIKKVKDSAVYIRYFNGQGILDKENTKHRFKEITKLSFDDRYANVFSKYVGN